MGAAESQDRAVFRIALTEDEQRVVNAEWDSHPDSHVCRKMLVLWLLHCGLTRHKAAEIAGLDGFNPRMLAGKRALAFQ
jgi:hypothetical protein